MRMWRLWGRLYEISAENEYMTTESVHRISEVGRTIHRAFARTVEIALPITISLGVATVSSASVVATGPAGSTRALALAAAPIAVVALAVAIAVRLGRGTRQYWTTTGILVIAGSGLVSIAIGAVAAFFV